MNIQPGGASILAWNIKNKPALVVGAGDVASGRVGHLLNSDAIVTVVAPSITNQDLKDFINSSSPLNTITYIAKSVSLDDHDDDDKNDNNGSTDTNSNDKSISAHQLLIDPKTNEPKFEMVLTAIDTPGVSQAIHKVCKKYRIPVNVADVPPLCDFYFTSTIREGPLQVAVSTGGSAPRLARRVRQDIEKFVTSDLGIKAATFERTQKLRMKLREFTENHPELHETEKLKISSRMKWMSVVCDTLPYKELAELTDEQIDEMVNRYPKRFRDEKDEEKTQEN